ncbi:hypothetical protein Tco_0382827 [Tanacetum coccineum]
MAFVSSNNSGSTNEAVNTFSWIFSFNQTIPQLAIEEQQQRPPYDLKEYGFRRCQMAYMTKRARRFLKNTRRRITVNGNESIGFDKSKVECNNFHKRDTLQGSTELLNKKPRQQNRKLREMCH